MRCSFKHLIYTNPFAHLLGQTSNNSECDGRDVTDASSLITDLSECTIIKGDLTIGRLPASWR